MKDSEGRIVAVQPETQMVEPMVACVTAGLSALNRPGFDGGSISWRKMESCQTTPAATSPRIAIQLS